MTLFGHSSSPRASVVATLARNALFVLLTFATHIAHAETASVHLQDGSTIRGEVVSLAGGSYQIQTQTLGVLTIPQHNIKMVEFGASNNTASPATDSAPDVTSAENAQMAAITSRLQNSPALLGDIQALSNDPAIMAIVKDPEIQRLIASGDYASLMANPKMRKLMGNAKIRDITSKLK